MARTGGDAKNVLPELLKFYSRRVYDLARKRTATHADALALSRLVLEDISAAYRESGRTKHTEAHLERLVDFYLEDGGFEDASTMIQGEFKPGAGRKAGAFFLALLLILILAAILFMILTAYELLVQRGVLPRLFDIGFADWFNRALFRLF